MKGIILDKNDTQIKELDENINKLRFEIGQKMDSYFILENKEVYDSMLNYSKGFNTVNDNAKTIIIAKMFKTFFIIFFLLIIILKA